MQELFLFVSEHIILVSIWFICLTILIFSFTKHMFLKSIIINNIQAIQLIDKNKAIIIDTRTDEIFQTGHIFNSINIPLKNIFLGNLNQIKEFKKSPIILIINNSYEYNKCIKHFLKYGFNNIYILKNALNDWNCNHLPLFINNIHDK
ncbi:rhodanese-like domain-containing protein [Buchnera aphidicola]|uniref:Rhodanese-like domain-containing protein n=1 Tax=Buchnera aphidicola subsp. Uroleucon sonchi TaxID=118118 RepID=A0A6C1FEM2_BUCUN|nr:rhodanese-like domain-containing protein [Buchnera aphidicola]QIE01812.1 rhodanese-like domain-containing protein [Buchnera aphidicola (Uroleucon sonchi)]